MGEIVIPGRAEGVNPESSNSPRDRIWIRVRRRGAVPE
jgi:hypothetical protein